MSGVKLHFDTLVRPYGKSALEDAAARILSGQCVAVATETVYGLAADATNATAVAGIYAAKGRPDFNPLIVHVLDVDAAGQLAVFPDRARELAARYWPGPLTLVLPFRASSGVARLVTAGLDTIAVRVPAHPAMRALLSATARPLAAPSANASGGISATRADHVARSLNGRIPLILDSGPCAIGLESTIIAVGENGQLRLLRPGAIDLALSSLPTKDIEAPGQMTSHYAPAKRLRLDAMYAEDGEWMIGYGAIKGNVNLSESGDLVEAAARLFDYLHMAEASHAPKIAIAPIPAVGLGLAINDRLNRAAA
jgi:L-threonylcarbamoyladenylate synthase